MRRLSEIFQDTRFLGSAPDAEPEEAKLWMIAEHLHDDERAVAFLSLSQGNLLLTQKRIVELAPHLDVQGFWNVLNFKGYQVANEVYLREVVGFALDPQERGGTLHLQVGEREVLLPVPVSPRSRDPRADLEAFAACLEAQL